MLSVKASRAARFLLLKWHRKDQRKRREGREGGREEKEGDRKQGKDWRGVLGHGHYAVSYCSPGLVSELEGVGA